MEIYFVKTYTTTYELGKSYVVEEKPLKVIKISRSKNKEVFILFEEGNKVTLYDIVEVWER